MLGDGSISFSFGGTVRRMEAMSALSDTRMGFQRPPVYRSLQHLVASGALFTVERVGFRRCEMESWNLLNFCIGFSYFGWLLLSVRAYVIHLPYPTRRYLFHLLVTLPYQTHFIPSDGSEMGIFGHGKIA